MARLRQAPLTQPFTPQELQVQLRRAAAWLRVAGLLTFVGWIIPVPQPEFDGIGVKIAWAAIAGSMLCFGARSLRKHREPGLFPLLVAMVPFSPAVMLSLPLSLRILRMLARPEVKAYLESPAQANSAR